MIDTPSITSYHETKDRMDRQTGDTPFLFLFAQFLFWKMKTKTVLITKIRCTIHTAWVISLLLYVHIHLIVSKNKRRDKKLDKKVSIQIVKYIKKIFLLDLYTRHVSVHVALVLKNLGLPFTLKTFSENLSLV